VFLLDSNLPPPLRPDRSEDDDDYAARGSLSDFSDYESSDEEKHNQYTAAGASSRPTSGSYGGARASTSSSRAYAMESDDELDTQKDPRQGLMSSAVEEDPFADPFADHQEVQTPGIAHKSGMNW
jgi:LAS seventeen-binding protein 5